MCIPQNIFYFLFTFYSLTICGQNTNLLPQSTDISDINLFLNKYDQIKGDTIQAKLDLKPLLQSNENEFKILYHVLLAKSFANNQDGLNNKSKQHFEIAFSLSKLNSDRAFYVWSKFNYIEYLYHYRSISEALPLLISTLDIANDLKSNEIIQPAKMFKLTGWIFQTLGDDKETLIYLSKALKFADSIPNEKAAILNALGHYYYKQKNFVLAEKYFNQTLDLSLKHKNYVRYARALGSLSEIEKSRGNFTKAIDLVKQDLKFSITYDDPQNTMYAYILLAKLHFQTNSKNLAREALNNAEQIAKSKTYFGSHEYDILKLKIDLLDNNNVIEELELRRNLAELEKKIIKTDGDEVFERLNWNLQKQKYQAEISHANLLAQNSKYKSLLALFILIILIIITLFILYRNQQKLKLINIKTQEDERERIASDLHDNIINKLTVIRLKLILNHDVKEIDDFLQLVIDDSRRLSHHLLPPMLESQPVEITLQEVLNSWSSVFKIDFQVSNPNEIEFSNDIKLHIIRIVQELIQNVYKHADATKIKCSVIITDNDLKLSFSDNGKGLDKDLANKKSGIGLKNIKNRLEQIKASSNLISTNNGTTFTFKIKNN